MPVGELRRQRFQSVGDAATSNYPGSPCEMTLNPTHQSVSAPSVTLVISTSDSLRRKERVINSQRGFSLLEALIALVVLSIGLIGVAAMQLKALQSANAGYQRSVASVAAVDAQERLWAQLATLETGQTCEDIDISGVQSAWKEHWFQNSGATPLRGASSSQSRIAKGDSGSDCRIDVTVALGENNDDQFSYFFLLPKVESSP
ncbi:type IV pilus modification protein PilV [Vreelandella titanicae]|uniref:Type IV pilus modification protein PilV n=1 Tax=Vreelandella titanicae TaxID=664683 RepID=A0AAP9NQQ9_9GAMM|nr:MULTISPECIES: type IV pilus modification protein PilV [Halomonas]QKS25267.1 hypothetical protein FX987_03063 [Halomonas titanicae]CDG53582.1 conserved hypothetical protein [Halomonas sp. A3H3]SDJ21076.1 type IV pilus modification protein PilV [Halomonas titanicae]